jgi:hypothetical protein
MRFDSLQDSDEIDVGIDLVKNTRRDQALDLADALRPGTGPFGPTCQNTTYRWC